MNGERKDRETPRGRKDGGRAWWSREAARQEASSARTFKEAARTVSVGFATWLLLWNDSASGKGDAAGDLCVWVGNLERTFSSPMRNAGGEGRA